MIKIAIDGPSGSGKSTLAKNLARKLGFIYVDTGALYRTIGLYMKENSVDLDNESMIEENLPKITLKLAHDENGEQQVILNGKNVGDKIRSSEMSAAASAVSKIKAVRAFLLDTQRNIAETKNVIMDGRDIGTVIFPTAQAKIFLTAKSSSRAERRYQELIEKGEKITLEKVQSDLENRDKNDSTRAEAPAIAAPDAVQLDTSDLMPEQTLEKALQIIYNKIPSLRK